MSANKKGKKEGETELSGLVVKKKFGTGSKSERDAICLQTEKGEYLLRRVGANPFQDAGLQQWIGKEITAFGIISDYTFFAKKLIEK